LIAGSIPVLTAKVKSKFKNKNMKNIAVTAQTKINEVMEPSPTPELLDILLQPEIEVSENEAEVVEDDNADPIVVGATFSSPKQKLLYTRKGKQNLVACHSFEITKLNATGRRITCVFRNDKNEVVLERRVYREWVELMIEEFSK
jgi:hypothetical protein